MFMCISLQWRQSWSHGCARLDTVPTFATMQCALITQLQAFPRLYLNVFQKNKKAQCHDWNISQITAHTRKNLIMMFQSTWTINQLMVKVCLKCQHKFLSPMFGLCKCFIYTCPHYIRGIQYYTEKLMSKTYATPYLHWKNISPAQQLFLFPVYYRGMKTVTFIVEIVLRCSY